VEEQSNSNLKNLNNKTTDTIRPSDLAEQEAAGIPNSVPDPNEKGNAQHIDATSESELGQQQESGGASARSSPEVPDETTKEEALQERKGTDAFDIYPPIPQCLEIYFFLALPVCSLTVYCAMTAADRHWQLSLL
jgi:hypothetical protein